ncbi:MAG: S8 family serine peptidase [Pyrinomonadaceae bacterium]
MLSNNSGSALIPIHAKRSVAVLLVLLLTLSPAMAGITISPTNGIVMTGADGIVMTGADGIVMTGADGYVTYEANGIVMTGADGIVMTGADTFSTPNSVRITSADGANISRADGIVMTGADGIVMTGADGTTYRANSVTVTLANGIVMTGADGIVMTGADGVQRSGVSGIVMTGADGIVMTGADGIVMTGADGVQATGADGVVFSVMPDGLTFAGVTGIVMTGADGIVMTGADGIVMTGADGIVMTGADTSSGLRSVDAELALLLNETVDDSSINVILVYHSLPVDSDFADLQRLGIQGGTRFRALPMVMISGTKDQLAAVSHLPAVRSMYSNRTLTFNSDPEVRTVTGVERARSDADLIARYNGLHPTGRNVTVAVLDTGIDATHSDLSGRIVSNIKLADTQSASAGFNYPVNSENLPNTDQLYGHGTFVAGIIAGNGARAAGKFAGVAPDANLVGLSAGDATLVYVLNGLDYLLASRSALDVRVVNCSFSANTPYDTNDPVNVATKMLTDAGINVVFSAGNTGPGSHTLNPYAVAPWVVSVGATDSQGRLAAFSSRGDFASDLFRPTLVAPGVDVVSLRGSSIANVTGAAGLAGADAKRLNSSELPYYTTANGTSFSAPQVAGAIALMLEANPSLTPAQVRRILQGTATPLPSYYQHEVGAGMLNVHAAVLQAAFPTRRIGDWRILNSGQVRFFNDPLTTFSGTVQPGGTVDSSLGVSENSLFAAIQIGWGPLLSTNDLSLRVYNNVGTMAAQADTLNLIGLTGKQERVALVQPTAGTWRISVRNSLGAVGTAQKFVGVVQVGRASYAPMSDVNNLHPSVRDAILQNIRTLTMQPIGSKFRPELIATRADVARALVAGAQVPQYLASHSLYQDVQDPITRVFVESVQNSPNGSCFTDAVSGGRFRPNEGVTRIAAAVALVRAAGLRTEAEAKAGTPLAFLDAASVPDQLRGYVSVAIAEGLLHGDSFFRPQNPLTRGELAQAVALIERRGGR